jgi:hypothetical protein
MFGFKRLFRLQYKAANRDSLPERNLRFLVITEDDAFYSRLQRIASVCGWRIERAASVRDAVGFLRFETIPLIVCESGFPDWRAALEMLTRLPSHHCILLASPVVDEYLRREVVQYRGYDVLAKFASPEEIMRELRFAWFWTIRSHGQGTGLTYPES